MQNYSIVNSLKQFIGRGISGSMIISLVLFSSAARAGTTDTDDENLAIEGYDPVAYFTMLQSVKGVDSINHEWLDRKWVFYNQEHKQLFMDDPMRYLPNYGGFCSTDAVIPGHNLVHDIDPETWRIVDNKLYLFYSEDSAVRNVPAVKWKKVKAGLQ
jgi:hypothetical protein